MGYINAVFALALLPVALAAETCPPANQLSPCTCDREGLSCNAANNTEQIRKAFRATFPFKGVSNVWIQGTPITTIPRDVFGNVMSLAFYIEMNQITTVSKEAFDPSKEHLQVLSLFGNQLNGFWYSSLGDFPELHILNLGRNKFTSIPANAFSHQTLSTIILPQNSISSIGQNAFYNLPSLSKVDLTSNSLKTLGPNSFRNIAQDTSLELVLIDNQISSVSSTAFQEVEPAFLDLTGNKLNSLKQDAFGSLLSRIIPNGGIINVSGNPLTCVGCDYKWIVSKKADYYNHIFGFVCPDGSGILDLTSSKIRC